MTSTEPANAVERACVAAQETVDAIGHELDRALTRRTSAFARATSKGIPGRRIADLTGLSEPGVRKALKR